MSTGQLFTQRRACDNSRVDTKMMNQKRKWWYHPDRKDTICSQIPSSRCTSSENENKSYLNESITTDPVVRSVSKRIFFRENRPNDSSPRMMMTTKISTKTTIRRNVHPGCSQSVEETRNEDGSSYNFNNNKNALPSASSESLLLMKYDNNRRGTSFCRNNKNNNNPVTVSLGNSCFMNLFRWIILRFMQYHLGVQQRRSSRFVSLFFTVLLFFFTSSSSSFVIGTDAEQNSNLLLQQRRLQARGSGSSRFPSVQHLRTTTATTNIEETPVMPTETLSFFDSISLLSTTGSLGVPERQQQQQTQLYPKQDHLDRILSTTNSSSSNNGGTNVTYEVPLVDFSMKLITLDNQQMDRIQYTEKLLLVVEDHLTQYVRQLLVEQEEELDAVSNTGVVVTATTARTNSMISNSIRSDYLFYIDYVLSSSVIEWAPEATTTTAPGSTPAPVQGFLIFTVIFKKGSAIFHVPEENAAGTTSSTTTIQSVSLQPPSSQQIDTSSNTTNSNSTTSDSPLNELITKSLSQEEGFWKLLYQIQSDPLLLLTGKIQIAIDNIYIGEGNVPESVTYVLQSDDDYYQYSVERQDVDAVRDRNATTSIAPTPLGGGANSTVSPTNATDTGSEDDKEADSGGIPLMYILIACVVGALLILVIILIICRFRYLKRKHKESEERRLKKRQELKERYNNRLNVAQMKLSQSLGDSSVYSFANASISNSNEHSIRLVGLNDTSSQNMNRNNHNNNNSAGGGSSRGGNHHNNNNNNNMNDSSSVSLSGNDSCSMPSLTQLQIARRMQQTHQNIQQRQQQYQRQQQMNGGTTMRYPNNNHMNNNNNNNNASGNNRNNNNIPGQQQQQNFNRNGQSSNMSVQSTGSRSTTSQGSGQRGNMMNDNPYTTNEYSQNHHQQQQQQQHDNRNMYLNAMKDNNSSSSGSNPGMVGQQNTHDGTNVMNTTTTTTKNRSPNSMNNSTRPSEKAKNSSQLITHPITEEEDDISEEDDDDEEQEDVQETTTTLGNVTPIRTSVRDGTLDTHRYGPVPPQQNKSMGMYNGTGTSSSDHSSKNNTTTNNNNKNNSPTNSDAIAFLHQDEFGVKATSSGTIMTLTDSMTSLDVSQNSGLDDTSERELRHNHHNSSPLDSSGTFLHLNQQKQQQLPEQHPHKNYPQAAYDDMNDSLVLI